MALKKTKQGRAATGILFILAVLAVFLAIFIRRPQPRWDWEKQFLPLAKDLMGPDNADHEIFKGLVVVITGSTSGIGKALTLLLTSKGATVVATGRSKSKLLQLQAEVSSNTTITGELIPITMEMSNLQSVAEGAEEIKRQFPSIDVLVCNAGMHYQKGFNILSVDFWKDMWSTDGMTTAFGHDLSFTVNYLSHFLLTEKLTPELLSTGDDVENKREPMVLHMSSSYHWGADGRDLESTIGADGITKNAPLAAQPGGGSWWWRGPRAYTNSKLAQILHGRALQREHQPGLNNVFVCPAWAATSIGGDEGSVVHTGLSLLAFPLDSSGGWGLQSTLRALLDRKQEDDHDFFINTGLVKVTYSMPLNCAFPAWVSDTGLRDAGITCLSYGMLVLQKFLPSSRPYLSSVESFNMTLANNLYDWSKEEIKDFL